MPARLGDIERALKAFGATVEKPSSGSHWKARLNGKMYTLPAGNGLRTELDNVYLKALCRAFDIDFNDFKSKL